MSLSLNILRIYFWLCSLETPSVSCLPCSFPTTPHDLFLRPLLLLFPCFTFLKTRLVWFCLNLVISAFQFDLVPSIFLKLYDSFTKFTSHLLLVLLPGNSCWFLSTMLVAYCKLPLISALFLTYFPTLLLLFPYFSFLKTRLVWYCPAFQLELIPCFLLTVMSLSLNILRIYFRLCSLETPSVSCLQ